MDEVIQINGLTKDYGDGRGVFDIDLSVRQGEVFGLAGINGSGKTTIIRHLMGFLKPDKGSTSILKKDSLKYAAELKRSIGYIPGEIAFPDIHSGMDFFKLQAEYLGIRDMSHVKALSKMFNLDANAKLKRMSKGMKQKTAIVAAFMADADILLLDEATTGLDPLMQSVFTDLIKEEKRRGKTIFMSSHMFAEMESTCDRVAFLKNGKIIHVVDMKTIRGNEKVKEYKIEFNRESDYEEFLTCAFDITRRQDEYRQVTIHIPDTDIDRLFGCLSTMNVRFISHHPYTLEACFKEIYNNTEAA